MTDFVKIRGSYYQLEHIIAVKKIKPFRDLSGKTIQYVVRLSEEAAGGEESRFRNVWCAKNEVESFLHRMRGLPELPDEDLGDGSQETLPGDVPPGQSPASPDT